MRIYAKFENIPQGVDDAFVPVQISLKPINNGLCKYLDIEEDKLYNCREEEDNPDDSDWKVYSGEVCMGEYLYNPNTKEYINSIVIGSCRGKENYAKLKDGRILYGNKNSLEGGYQLDWCMYQEYKNGKPIGEPRFEKL